MRADRASVGSRHPAVVPAGHSGRSGRHRAGRFFHRGEPLRHQMGHVPRCPHRNRLRLAGASLIAHSDHERPNRLEAGGGLYFDISFPGLVRRFDFGDGRSLFDRLRRAGLRGRDLPRRRDHRSQSQCAARHAGQRRDGRCLFRRPSGCLAGCSRPRAARRGSCHRARSNIRTALRQLRQGGGDLVHHAQHVPRDDAAAGRGGAHTLAAERGRSPAALSGPAIRDGLSLGSHAADSLHVDFFFW